MVAVSRELGHPNYFSAATVLLAHGGIIFLSVRKCLRNGKETSTCLKKV